MQVNVAMQVYTSISCCGIQQFSGLQGHVRRNMTGSLVLYFALLIIGLAVCDGIFWLRADVLSISL